MCCMLVGLKHWEYCLSLGSAAVWYAILTFCCAVWQLAAVFVHVDFSGDITEPIVRDDDGTRQVVLGLMSVSHAGAAALNFAVVLLTGFAVGLRSPKLCRLSSTVILTQGIYNALFLVGVWSIFDCSQNGAKPHSAGLHPDAWFGALLAWPAAVILASLASVQSAGNSGFEGRQKVASPRSHKPDDGHVSDAWARVGTWTVGLTLGQGVLLLSGVCFLMAAKTLRSFWNLHFVKSYEAQQIGWAFMLEGLILCCLAATTFLGTVLTSTFSLLVALFCCIGLGPIATIVAVWWNVLLYRWKVEPGVFVGMQFSIIEQYVCVFCCWAACRTLTGFIAAKTKGRFDIDIPKDDDPESEALVSSASPA
ncbi:UNVERIFIED_CONTAM: hypothetical protein HHA_218270 [Hammondia hammondi]|eukprot:XP_008889329.1 hypothetical protein HHA_218270 [Hammondia hammondi]